MRDLIVCSLSHWQKDREQVLLLEIPTTKLEQEEKEIGKWGVGGRGIEGGDIEKGPASPYHL